MRQGFGSAPACRSPKYGVLGDVASAAGMRFTAPWSAIHAGSNPKYFGQSHGVTWHNLAQ